VVQLLPTRFHRDQHIAFLQACNAVHMSTARFRFQVALEARAISGVLLSRSGFWRARGCGCASAWVLALDMKKKKECERAFFCGHATKRFELQKL